MSGLYAFIGICLAIYVLWWWTMGPGRGQRMTPPQRRRTRLDTWVLGNKPGKMVPKPGWWHASDGKWYPPQQHPKYRHAAAAATSEEEVVLERNDSTAI